MAIYKENIAYAEFKGDGKIEPSKAESKDDQQPAPEERAHKATGSVEPTGEPQALTPKTPLPQKNKAALMDGERELVAGLLSKDANFRVIVSGVVGVKEIERLISKLELDKEILADDDVPDFMQST